MERKEKKKVRKVLNQKMIQLHDIVADIDSLLTGMETYWYRVCIFGSARLKPETDNYKQAYELAKALASRNIDIVTGGGPGLMEAANKGAKDAGLKARSIGLPIELPFESDANSHLDVKHHHKRFSSRLDEFMRISHAIIITPGGIGTILELFYAWQLIQVEHIKERPIILLGGGEMWKELILWMEKFPLAENLMSKTDFDAIQYVETIEDAIGILEPHFKAFEEQREREEAKSR